MRWPLHIRILVWLAAGVILGLVMNVARSRGLPESTPGLWSAWLWVQDGLRLIGDAFIRVLRFVAVPLVLGSLITAAGELTDLSRLRRVAAWTLGIFAFTGVASVVIGLVIAGGVRPGAFVEEQARAELLAQFSQQAGERIRAAESTSLRAMVLQAIPVNPFEALARGDMLQVVVMGLGLGLVLAVLPRSAGEPLLAFCRSLTAVLMEVVRVVMVVAPYAVFALMVPIAATLGFSVLAALGVYALCVVGGLLVVLLVLYPLVLRGLSRVRVVDLARGIAPAQALAFSSSSSAATLPVTMRCLRDRLGVPEDVTNFVCSAGTTINMDGTAVMQAVAAVFLAQVYGLDLSAGQMFTILVTAALAAIGAPGIPGGGIVLLVVVLQSAGIPIEGIALILAVDRVLDMARTVINVTGDAVAAVIVAGRVGRSERPAAGAAAL